MKEYTKYPGHFEICHRIELKGEAYKEQLSLKLPLRTPSWDDKKMAAFVAKYDEIFE
jgi:hypothetical protein